MKMSTTRIGIRFNPDTHFEDEDGYVRPKVMQPLDLPVGPPNPVVQDILGELDVLQQQAQQTPGAPVVQDEPVKQYDTVSDAFVDQGVDIDRALSVQDYFAKMREIAQNENALREQGREDEAQAMRAMGDLLEAKGKLGHIGAMQDFINQVNQGLFGGGSAARAMLEARGKRLSSSAPQIDVKSGIEKQLAEAQGDISTGAKLAAAYNKSRQQQLDSDKAQVGADFQQQGMLADIQEEELIGDSLSQMFPGLEQVPPQIRQQLLDAHLKKQQIEGAAQRQRIAAEAEAAKQEAIQQRHDQRMEVDQQKLGIQKDQRVHTALTKEREALLTPPSTSVLGRLYSQQQTLANARATVEKSSDNTVAAGLMGPKMAKGVGDEVGNLTAQEQQNALGQIGAPGLYDKVQQFFRGTRTPKTRDEALELIDAMEVLVQASIDKEQGKRLDSFYNLHQDRLKSYYGTEDEEQIKQQLKGSFGLPDVSKSDQRAVDEAEAIGLVPQQQSSDRQAKIDALIQNARNGDVEAQQWLEGQGIGY